MPQHRSVLEIDSKVQAEGFAELKRHWRLFQKRKVSPDELDADQVDSGIAKHITPWGLPALCFATVVGAACAWLLTRYSFAFVQSKSLLAIIFVWSAVNLILLACHCLTLLRRYAVAPMEKLIGQKLALVLQSHDYRQAWSQKEQIVDARQKMLDAGVSPTWDDPQYKRQYRKEYSDWIATEAKSPEQRIHQVLIEFLGRKDPKTRKFQPGVLIDSLREKKKSVSRFVAAHQSLIGQSREGQLSIDCGIELLEQLLAEEVIAESKGAKRLSSFIENAHVGYFVPYGSIMAEVWKRDPWVDLTHQQEFYSSSSLRGVKRVGRGTKGRMGPFLYLDDPAVCALDFSDGPSRKVRVRLGIGLAGENGTPVLYVDGIEGTNSLDRSLIAIALEDYARACNVDAILFNKYPHNQVPRYYIEDISRNYPHRVVEVEYISHRPQYLDGFGFPIEPFEYAMAKGEVSAIVMNLKETPSMGRDEQTRDRIRSWLRRGLLWVILVNAIGYAALSIAISNPWMLPALAVFVFLGVGAHIAVQRLGLRN